MALTIVNATIERHERTPHADAMAAAHSARSTATRAALALVALVALVAGANALENPFARRASGGTINRDQEVIAEALTDEHVVKLDAKAFDGEIKKSRYNFVMFYAPWDGHSKAFMPRWLSYARTHQMAGTEMTFGLVDATREKELDARFEI